jgi:hypothetical protein
MTDKFSLPFAENRPIARRDALKCGLVSQGV